MNPAELELFKKSVEFGLDDPEGTSLDEALVGIVEYLTDELLKQHEDVNELEKAYPVLLSFMDAIYETE